MKIEEKMPFGFADTSFQAAGGEEGVQKLVHTFYSNMDTISEAKALRQMHSQSLEESEDKLSRFLCGWLGGPKRYGEKYGPINIPQAHRHLTISESTRDIWLMCMDKAIDRQPYSIKFSSYLKEQIRVPAEKIFQVAKNT